MECLPACWGVLYFERSLKKKVLVLPIHYDLSALNVLVIACVLNTWSETKAAEFTHLPYTLLCS